MHKDKLLRNLSYYSRINVIDVIMIASPADGYASNSGMVIVALIMKFQQGSIIHAVLLLHALYRGYLG